MKWCYKLNSLYSPTRSQVNSRGSRVRRSRLGLRADSEVGTPTDGSVHRSFSQRRYGNAPGPIFARECGGRVSGMDLIQFFRRVFKRAPSGLALVSYPILGGPSFWGLTP